jgi:hypothetical protein
MLGRVHGFRGRCGNRLGTRQGPGRCSARALVFGVLEAR